MITFHLASKACDTIYLKREKMCFFFDKNVFCIRRNTEHSRQNYELNITENKRYLLSCLSWMRTKFLPDKEIVVLFQQICGIVTKMRKRKMIRIILGFCLENSDEVNSSSQVYGQGSSVGRLGIRNVRVSINETEFSEWPTAIWSNRTHLAFIRRFSASLSIREKKQRKSNIIIQYMYIAHYTYTKSFGCASQYAKKSMTFPSFNIVCNPLRYRSLSRKLKYI